MLVDDWVVPAEAGSWVCLWKRLSPLYNPSWRHYHCCSQIGMGPSLGLGRSSCVTLWRLFNLSEPSFPFKVVIIILPTFSGLLWGLHLQMHTKMLARGLVHNKCPIKASKCHYYHYSLSFCGWNSGSVTYCYVSLGYFLLRKIRMIMLPKKRVVIIVKWVNACTTFLSRAWPWRSTVTVY